MKRASYRNGVAFIAENDEPLDRDADNIAGYTTVVLMSELFGVTPDKVAADVLAYRIKNEDDMP